MLADDHDRPTDPDAGPSTRARAKPAAGRFDRLVRAGRARRLSPRRLLVGGLIAGALGWGGFEGARIGLRRLAAWVAAQPEHQVRFDAIALVPSPPPFIRRGAEGILAQVRKQGGYPETVSALGLDAEQLRRDLALSPWIEEVGVVVRAHRRLSVQVTYRRPMALMAWPSGKWNEDHCVLVDRRGVEMPCDDNHFVWRQKKPDLVPLGVDRLVQVRGFGEGRPDGIGRTWEALDRGIPAGMVAQAVALAGFLRDHRATGADPSGPDLDLGRIEWERRTRRFTLIGPQRGRIVWGAGPGSEGPDEPKAAEKWAMLRRFVAARGGVLQLRPDEYLVLEHPEAAVRKVATRSNPPSGDSKLR